MTEGPEADVGMKVPPSDWFTSVDLSNQFNIHRQDLTGLARAVERTRPGGPTLYGPHSVRGIEFEFGEEAGSNAVHLTERPVVIPLHGATATYVLFVHAVEDRVTNYDPDIAAHAVDGNEVGRHVSDYEVHYTSGDSFSTKILRRFAIQQSRIRWGASAFAAVPAEDDLVLQSMTDGHNLRRLSPVLKATISGGWGQGEPRNLSGRDRSDESLWVYAMPNPHPDRPITSITCHPRTERSLIYAVATTTVEEHPLRYEPRRKARLQLPHGATLNANHELDEIGIDLGHVISARAILDYNADTWHGDHRNAQPERSSTEVLIEFTAHQNANLYVGAGSDEPVVYNLNRLASGETASPAGLKMTTPTRSVHIRVTERGSNQVVPVRLHMHGGEGEYLPPRDHHRRVNPHWFEDMYGEFINGLNQYAYISGECEAELPLGVVHVDIQRGYEVAPIRTSVEVTADSDELVFELDRVLGWRERGWVTADTHVHFLSPQTALLEGSAEGVNVVNLLASQWGEMFSNVSDFDGRTTIGATDFGGDGEFLVRVGTENRMQVLGHISLLGYRGRLINPLCTGGPSESALGDPVDTTLAEWAQRCLDQGGLTVLPHGPDPQCERAADIVLGLIDAMEVRTFQPDEAPLNPYGIADWYRYLNLGYHIPIVGGSDKMSSTIQLGGVRTYTQMGNRPFTYENWMSATRSGDTFVTVGPLADMSVEGIRPGGKLSLPVGGATLSVPWRVESVNTPIQQVEIVAGGIVQDQVNVGGALSAEGTSTIHVEKSTWIALRVRASADKTMLRNVSAHTSAVLVVVDDAELFSQPDAMTVLDQIEGAMAFVDTIATRPDAQRFKQLRATLESAHSRLHKRLHQHGVFHAHTALHHHIEHHEH